MGTIVLNDIDISGNFRTSMLGFQRYSTTDITLTDVKLGGATSNITGTFGSSLRFDAVGTGTVASPANGRPGQHALPRPLGQRCEAT